MPRQPTLWNEPAASAGAVEAWARRMGYDAVLGVDEAGRGCLAGPVAAAAVILPRRLDAARGLTDSKLLSPRRREELLPYIRRIAIALGVGWSDASEVDRIGILPATLHAMRRAVEQALCDYRGPTGVVIVDGISAIPGIAWPQKTWIRGDRQSLACAAASIVAKVERDARMTALAAEYPGYGFEKHKGYGTREHLQALARLGPCAIHRRSFAPLKPR